MHADIDRDRAESILQSAPFHQFLGVSFSAYDPGRVVIECPFREELFVNPDREIVHGGVLSALCDIAGHYAVLSAVGARVPTVDFRTDYLRPGRRGPLRIEGIVERVGGTIAVADAIAAQEREDGWTTVAVGRGAYGVAHVER